MASGYLCHTADISAVWQSRHVCCVTQQPRLLCFTADLSGVSHSRHVCCVRQQKFLLCHTADKPAVSHSRHVCSGPQQTCLLCHTADMSAASHSRRVRCVTQLHPFYKSVYFIRASTNSQGCLAKVIDAISLSLCAYIVYWDVACCIPSLLHFLSIIPMRNFHTCKYNIVIYIHIYIYMSCISAKHYWYYLSYANVYEQRTTCWNISGFYVCLYSGRRRFFPGECLWRQCKFTLLTYLFLL